MYLIIRFWSIPYAICQHKLVKKLFSVFLDRFASLGPLGPLGPLGTFGKRLILFFFQVLYELL